MDPECRKGKARCVIEEGSQSCRECLKKERNCVWLESNRGKWSRTARRSKSRKPENETGSMSGSIMSTNTSTNAPIGYSSITAAARATSSQVQTPSTRTSPDALGMSAVSPSSSIHTLHSVHSTAATSSNQSDDVVDVHNPGHFKVDHALFPLGVLAEASRQIASNEDQSEPTLAPTARGSTVDHDARWSSSSQMLGVANNRYFHVDIRHQLLQQGQTKTIPSIIADRIITASQAEELFEIFFNQLNPHLGLLDRKSATPQSCSLRSPFLFMSICAVASRFYLNGVLYSSLLPHARRAGLDAMLVYKSTATVQGFVILATWSQPSESYQTDNAYLFAGIAIRVGVEIGLHRKIVLSYPENMDPAIKQTYTSEVLSRERTWFCVFVLDRSMSALTGKPPQAPETYEVRDVDNWWRRPEALLSDVFVSAEAQLLRLLYRCFDVIHSCNDTVTGVSHGLNYQVVVKDLQWRLDEWAAIWTQNLRDASESLGSGSSTEVDQGLSSRPLDLYLSYLTLYRCFFNLIPLSFGLHHCTIDGFNRVDQISFVTRCYECAMRTLEVANNQLRPQAAFKTAPDISVFAVTYAACFLLKLIGPEFRHLFNEGTVLALVNETVAHLQDVSEDERHIHYLHSLFLHRHLSVFSTIGSPRSQRRPSTVQREDRTLRGNYSGTSNPINANSGRIHPGIKSTDASSANSTHRDSAAPPPALPMDLPSFLATNPMTRSLNTDISIDPDGSVNFVSDAGTEVFRPAEDMSSEWIDSVLGLQNRRDDLFSAALQMPPETSADSFSWFSALAGGNV